MKKFIIGVFSVFIIGLLGLAVSVLTMDRFKQEVRANEEYPVKNVQSIDVQMTSMDVEVSRSNDDKINVSSKGETRKEDESFYQVNLEHGGLEIHQTEQKDFQLFSFFRAKDAKLKMEVPDKMFNRLTMETTSGDVMISNVQVQEANINSTSGSIEIKKSIFEEDFTLKTTSGDVKVLSNTIHNGKYHTTSGSISDERTEGERINYQTISGDLQVNRSLPVKGTKVQTDSGDVSFLYHTSSESLALDFESNSGDPVIEWVDMVFKDKSDHKIIGMTSEENSANQLMVRTQSGDFSLQKE
ncbi:DUF4097 family beta strand repeat protein [Halobacillus kuroshimensis]|uniref:DUF4097 family beta strand repeat protein n=1 Tax=Halobacillus kuroshimensis TaxID=302481 RepID=A0ABS3DRC8_9BACI|nr:MULTISPECIES: DUF4097 family beta strand repeat-containing protein [Halobacillus]MBN8233895.1 DUF4097 family beta strand repeat protein [Halobacillus kuroshimensis]